MAANYKTYRLQIEQNIAGTIRLFDMEVVAKTLAGAEKIIRRGHYSDRLGHVLTSYCHYTGINSVVKTPLIRGIDYDIHFVDNYGKCEGYTHEEGYWLEKPYSQNELMDLCRYEEAYKPALITVLTK